MHRNERSIQVTRNKSKSPDQVDLLVLDRLDRVEESLQVLTEPDRFRAL